MFKFCLILHQKYIYNADGAIITLHFDINDIKYINYLLNIAYKLCFYINVTLRRQL